MEIQLCFSCLSRSLCTRPLSLFILPVSVSGCVFIYACPRELSHRSLRECVWVAMWLTTVLRKTVCAWPCVVCVCVCVVVCVCVNAYLAALHALRSPLSFLPLMLFPVVCKLLHWCTALCCLRCSGHCKCLNNYSSVGMSSHSLSSALSWKLTSVIWYLSLGVEGRGRRWSWAEICPTWWCSPTLLHHRSVWMKVKHQRSNTFTHATINNLYTLGSFSYPVFLSRYSRWRLVIQRDQSPIPGQSQSRTIPGF